MIMLFEMREMSSVCVLCYMLTETELTEKQTDYIGNRPQL
uniref:Uncharacterized protein n=1 Tax=Anguilla anguilla TaxID=7936 RepID=A0A0E9VSA3_ANGAN